MIKRILLLLFILNLFQHSAIAQKPNISDQLKELKKNIHDSTRIQIYNQLCMDYRELGQFDSAIYCGNAAIATVESALASDKTTKEFKKRVVVGKADAFNNIGLCYLYQADYPKALEFYLKALKLNEELGLKPNVATNLGNIGGVYWYQGNYAQALGYYLRALKLDEELNDQRGLGSDLSNIGGIYHEQSNYEKALYYYFRALKVNEKAGRKGGIAANLGNIGIVYYEQGLLKSNPAERDKLYRLALDFYFKALKIKKEKGNKTEIGKTVGNIGIVYCEQKDYPKALEYYLQALEIFKELGDDGGVAINLGNIGSLYGKQKNDAKAEEYFVEAAKLSEKIGDIKGSEEANKNLSDLYNRKGDYKKAYLHHVQFTIAKDSLFNIDKHDDITRKELTYEHDKKETAIKFEHEKEAAVAAAESKKQKIVIGLVVLALVLMVVFAIFIFRSLRASQKQKKIIELQKKLVEEQKHLVEEKQKDIIDSITYARRIQRSLMPTEKYINKNLTALKDKK